MTAKTVKSLEFKLLSNYIELIKLLKVMGVVETGGEAKMVVESGKVKVNNTTEFKKRKKIIKGDIVLFFDYEIKII